jgi:hypothetical protein
MCPFVVFRGQQFQSRPSFHAAQTISGEFFHWSEQTINPHTYFRKETPPPLFGTILKSNTSSRLRDLHPFMFGGSIQTIYKLENNFIIIVIITGFIPDH